VAWTAEAGLGATASAVMRVHAAGSVKTSLAAARRRVGVDGDVTTLGFEGLSEEDVCATVRLGRVVTGTASPIQVCGGVCTGLMVWWRGVGLKKGAGERIRCVGV
jgi:hypothetical protein